MLDRELSGLVTRASQLCMSWLSRFGIVVFATILFLRTECTTLLLITLVHSHQYCISHASTISTLRFPRSIPVTIFTSMISGDHSFCLCHSEHLDLLRPAAFVLLQSSCTVVDPACPGMTLHLVTSAGLSISMALETLLLLSHCTAGLQYLRRV